jgi:hypothetical protein
MAMEEVLAYVYKLRGKFPAGMRTTQSA